VKNGVADKRGKLSLLQARFLVLHVVSDRRGRAVIATAQPVDALRGGKVILYRLVSPHPSRFAVNRVELQRMESAIQSGSLTVVLSARRVLLPLNRTFAEAGFVLPSIDVVELEKLHERFSRPHDEQASSLPPLPQPTIDDDPATAVLQVGDSLLRIVETAIERGIEDVAGLLSAQDSARVPVSFEARRFDRAFVAELPTAPGVYWFLDKAGAVLYIGKARNLRERVSTYFSDGAPEEQKLRDLLSTAYDLQYRVTGSELEAVLEEHRRIKVCAPPLNTQIEVHERRPAYGRTRDLILFLKSDTPACLDVYLASPGCGCKRIRVERGKRIPRRLSSSIRRMFFSGKERSCILSDELQLVYTWFQANRDDVSFIDAGKTAGLEDCLRLVKNYIACDAVGHQKLELR
jgi:hypothetical protein